MSKIRNYTVWSMNKSDSSHRNYFKSTHNANTQKNYDDASKVLEKLPENKDGFKIIITKLN